MCGKNLKGLLESNAKWASDMTDGNPDFFMRLCEVQNPDYLWIGCSDSRVPANEIVGLQPGELFVHRNIANVVPNGDVNCLAVIQYAVEILRVKHIIVTGHYGCGGIEAAMQNEDHGQLDNWLAHVKDVYNHNYDELIEIEDKPKRADRLCELNVVEQVHNVAKASIVQRTWRNGGELFVHGWIYSLQDGILRDLDVSLSSVDELHRVYQTS
jgi:carbonic anhydrase